MENPDSYPIKGEGVDLKRENQSPRKCFQSSLSENVLTIELEITRPSVSKHLQEQMNV